MAFDNPFNTDGVPMDGNSSENFYQINDEDPAAEFLARERQELGDITTDGKSYVDLISLFNDYCFDLFIGSIGAVSQTVPESQYQALSKLDEQMNEPEKIRKWRDEFASRISKKDADEEQKRKEMREQAKKELDDFYKQRQEQMQRRVEENRVSNQILEKELLSNATPSTYSNGKTSDWDKITSLCEFNPKNNRSQKDLTRYRSVLLQLKQQQNNGK